MASAQIYIYPTDTVWGIGCDLYSEAGFYEIAHIKQTSSSKPLSLIFTDVEQVYTSFKFPKQITKSWLEYFFAQESTLGIPEQWSKIIMPEWAQINSEYISLRCLRTAPLKNLYQTIGNPFFTTSLNLQGHPPICNEADAKKFCLKHCPQAIMIEGTQNIMSGRASSMVFIQERNNQIEFEVKREGSMIKELLIHLDLLRFV
jgi:L-threonylcarbamoyladenylate synthase